MLSCAGHIVFCGRLRPHLPSREKAGGTPERAPLFSGANAPAYPNVQKEVYILTEVISVRFRGGCKAYFFDPQGISVQEGDEVVVETAQGAEFGTCVRGNHMVEDHAVIQPLRPMHRLANEEDRKTVERNTRREKEAFAICEEKIAAHGLEMKLVDVECGFEGNKILFFFTADGRVDFRELVKDLASVFHARIELRQIGVRDVAKMLGGLGICGQPFCCKRFLDEFQPVSIKMAKTQNLSLNPTKISGSCGRLMCCLKYEQHAYEDAQTRMPKNDSFVQTPDGPGNISAINLVKETVTVRLDDAPEAPKTYQVGEIIVLRNGKGSRDGIDIPARPARIITEAEPEPFGMETDFSAPAAAASQHAAETSAPRRERSAHKAAASQSAPSAKEAPAKEAESSRGGEKPQGRRSHRGGRGRRNGGEEGKHRISSEKSAEKAAKQPASSRDPGPRPLRFASSIPLAKNAASPVAPDGADAKDRGERKNRRRGRRPFRRGRGGAKGGDSAKPS